MDEASKHDKTSEPSRRLCDLLLRCIPDEFAPRRDSTANVCGVHVQGRRAALYWLYHSKEHIRVYLDIEDNIATRDELFALLPLNIALQSRPFPRKGFALRTPLFFDLIRPEEAQGMAPLFSYLAGRRFRSSNKARSITGPSWKSPSEKETEDTFGADEGTRFSTLVNRYERDPKNRKLCIRHYGAVCQACGFNFGSIYGEIGEGYIHVHHLTALASLKGKAQKVDPIKEMMPVCPNCHEMLHQSDPPYTPEQLRSIIAEVKKKSSTLRSLNPKA
jgi:hypothetical protein